MDDNTCAEAADAGGIGLTNRGCRYRASSSDTARPFREGAKAGAANWLGSLGRLGAYRSSAGHPGFHAAPEATLRYRFTVGVKLVPKDQQNCSRKKGHG